MQRFGDHYLLQPLMNNRQPKYVGWSAPRCSIRYLLISIILPMISKSWFLVKKRSQSKYLNQLINAKYHVARKTAVGDLTQTYNLCENAVRYQQYVFMLISKTLIIIAMILYIIFYINWKMAPAVVLLTVFLFVIQAVTSRIQEKSKRFGSGIIRV